MSKDMFVGVARPDDWPRDDSYCLYHDESRDDVMHDDLHFHGILAVPFKGGRYLRQELARARQGYEGEIHFGALRDNTMSRKEEVARRWLNLYMSEWASWCYFKGNAINTKALYPNVMRQQDLYNERVALTLFGSICWFFHDKRAVHLRMFSDYKSVAANDNLVTQVMEDVLARVHRKRSVTPNRCPRVFFPDGQIGMLQSDARKAHPHLRLHCDLMQLTDLLIGTVAQAVSPRGSQQIRLDLAVQMAAFMEDCRFNVNGLRRNFSVSGYPNDERRFYDLAPAIFASAALPAV